MIANPGTRPVLPGFFDSRAEAEAFIAELRTLGISEDDRRVVAQICPLARKAEGIMERCTITCGCDAHRLADAIECELELPPLPGD